MIWALDLDDFRNRCGQGPHPLLNTIKSVLSEPRAPGYTDSKPAHHPEVLPPVQRVGSKKCWDRGSQSPREVVDHPPIQPEHFLPEVPGVRPPPGVPVCKKEVKCWDPDKGIVPARTVDHPPIQPEHFLPEVPGVRPPPGMEECKCWDPDLGIVRAEMVDHPPIQPEHFLPEVPGVRPPPGVPVCKKPDKCWDPNKGIVRVNAVDHPPIQPEHFLPEVAGVRPPPGVPVCPPGTVMPPGVGSIVPQPPGTITQTPPSGEIVMCSNSYT